MIHKYVETDLPCGSIYQYLFVLIFNRVFNDSCAAKIFLNL